MRILYVGFKGMNNTSSRLVSAMAGDRLLLTNSFSGIKRDIDALDRTYDAVLMFGIDKTLSASVRIEKRAEISGEVLKTKLSADLVSAKLRSNGIGCVISEEPTHYLCNEAYFRMLQKTDGKAIFIHIPGIRHMTDDLMKGITRSLGE